MLSQFTWGFDKWYCYKLGKCRHCFDIIYSECHLVFVLCIWKLITVFNFCQASGDSIAVSDIVRGTCRYLLFGQVLGDYVEYVVSIWTSVR